MDTLRVELFEFDRGTSLAEIIKTWVKRGLWFHTIEEHKRITYNIMDSAANPVKQKNGEVQQFASEDLVNEYLTANNMVSATVTPTTVTYYLIRNDIGRTVNHTDGTPKEFRKEEQALRTALYYNNDLVKIRQTAANYRVKGKKLGVK